MNISIPLTALLFGALNLLMLADACGQHVSRFYQDGKVGYKDQEKNILVYPTYDAGSDFSDGMAMVVKNEKRGYINTVGQEVIPLIYDDATLFVNGVACVKYAGRYGYINKEALWVIQPIFENAFAFSVSI